MNQRFEHVRRPELLPPPEHQAIDPYRAVTRADRSAIDKLFGELEQEGLLPKQLDALGSTALQQPAQALPTFDWEAATLADDSSFVRYDHTNRTWL